LNKKKHIFIFREIKQNSTKQNTQTQKIMENRCVSVDDEDEVRTQILLNMERINNSTQQCNHSIFTANLYGKDKVIAKRYEHTDDKGVSINAIREISVLLNLHHANIVDYYGVVMTLSNTYLVMEPMEMTLSQKISIEKRGWRKKEPEYKRYLFQVCEALHYCHSMGVMHRDIKPSNIFIRGENAKLGDFDSSRFFNLPLRKYSTDCTTIAYKAPEACSKEGLKITPAVDMWAIGCVFYYIVHEHDYFTYKDFTERETYLICAIENSQETKNHLRKYFELSEAGIEFMYGCMQLDVSKRISAVQALKHDYFCSLFQ